jgi:two-component system, sensor histidine kinase and response regulator
MERLDHDQSRKLMAKLSVAETAGPQRLELSRVFAVISVALGATVLLGWVLGLDSLKQVFPDMITMKVNAALGFLLGGVALWSIRPGHPISRRAVGFSIAVAIIGGVTLLEYVSGVSLGIDQLLVRTSIAENVWTAPGRMHPTTAFDFTLLGVALALIAADRGHRTAHALTMLAAMIALATLISYLYGVREFVGLASYGQMALHTSLGILALSTGVLLARPTRGLMKAITADGPGGLMARKLLPVAILTPIGLNALTLFANQSGHFDQSFGAAVRASCIVAILVLFIGRIAFVLLGTDRERLWAETERNEEQSRYHFLAQSMPQIVFTARPDGFVDFYNRRWYEYTGMTVDEVKEQGWRPVLHPDDLPQCIERWGEAVRTGGRYEVEYRFRRGDGTFRWHLARAEPRRDKDGQIIQWVGTCTDIHDQKRIEDDLRRSHAELEERVRERTAELRLANEDLRQGEERFRTLADSIPQLAWMARPDGFIFWYNKRWYDYTGTTLEQMQGWGWQSVHDPWELPRVVETIKSSFASGEPWECTFPIRRHDGVFRWHLTRMLPVKDDHGRVILWFGSNTDIDDQMRNQEAMRQAKEAAEAATRAKGEFLANMSHEIRTPMNGVLGMTELTLATDLTPRQREYLGLAKSSADALLTVIDDILDFSKIEAGKLELELVSFSIRDAVTDTLRTLILKADKKGLELACRIAPDVPEAVIGDSGRLRQVLVNLVGNAIKFTERGEVVVSVETNGHDELRFTVTDTGIGIPADKRAAIFNPFEQADGSTTRKYGGTGLGLTICTRLVELMSGQIRIDENPGGGSIFQFTALLKSDPAASAAQLAISPQVLQGLRVLIVDDNQATRQILQEILSHWGCLSVDVKDGPETLHRLDAADRQGLPFDLLMLDSLMPGLNGCSLAREIRSNPQFDAVKMFVMTASGCDDPRLWNELAISASLAKPIRHSELLGALLDLLDSSEPVCQLVPPEPSHLLTQPNDRRLRVLLAEDHPINQKVATRILENHGHRVTVVSNGQLAVEAVAATTYDVVLMDIQMPVMDGPEALAAIRLREQSEGGHLAIVALTAHAMKGDRERYLHMGFDDYLSKPINFTELATILDRIVVDNPIEPSTVPACREDLPIFDRAAALKGVGGDAQLFEEILGLFLEDGPRLLDEVRLAVENRDPQELNRHLHILRGSAGHFEASALVAAVRKLELIGRSGDFTDASRLVQHLASEFDRFRQIVDESRQTA